MKSIETDIQALEVEEALQVTDFQT